VCFSICTIFSFSLHFHVLPCEFLIFFVCQLSRHIPGPTVCVCLILHVFQFSCHISGPPVCTSHFFMFFSVSSNIPGHTYSVCLTFSTFLNFLANIQALQCVFIIFHVFHCFSTYSRSYNVCFCLHDIQFFSPFFMYYLESFLFSSFVSFLAIIQILRCEFPIF
jgi:hypothetical protein